ncbi:helix-turn-helix transcriptional regulator [Actinomadura kijaniata]|uniref:DNA-binding PadR family transcriptional regulator n=1 Tax=Actinomadura namibiensis TaxID=182080 RepID=A0A7W3QQA8_ACTNM|nr:PadR family transcriptional regulator [Actinomadura namibiensis]MBA8955436.1 DNA-binding PadR family transcriptional regulator [Actinomadura namibiensis]
MSLRHALLGLIAELDGASGYDLLKMFEISLDGAWSATQSQLYGELGRLTAGGLIEVTGEGPRGRREYGITRAGRAELEHWITEVEPRTNHRDDALLRVFLFGRVDGHRALAFVDRQRRALDDQVADLDRIEESVSWNDEDDLSFHGRLAMEWGKRLLRARRDWWEWAREEMADRDEREGRG